MESLRAFLNRVRNLPRRRRRIKARQCQQPPLRLVVKSFGGFALGLVLASVYGMTALFVQNHGLWYCVYTTVAIAFLTAFGMGLSIRVRANAMLMLPMLCSMKGKNLLLFLVFSMVFQGPMTNTLENFDRAAKSVVCGAELAMNQTQQLMERAATPLLPVLDKIKEITRNAHSVASRVQNLIKALTESVRHVARTLRNVLHFLVSIDEVCNAKLGTPYRKCNKVFDDARDDCMELLSVFNFLCHIVDGFRPLCGLAHVVQLFCIIPSYIVGHMKTRLAGPTITAFERMRQEFDFNVSASIHFDVNVSSSQSLQQVSQEIMEEVSVELGRFQEATGLLAYLGLFLLLLMYLQAVLYKHKYLHQDDFDNIYITEQFVELDMRMVREGKPTVLPLSQRETSTYFKPLSVYLTARERRAAALSALSILRHIAMGGLAVVLDLVVFWMFDLVHHQAQGDIVARAPIRVTVEVNGTGYASDIFKDIVASFGVLQKGNITVLSKRCLMEPSEPDYTEYMLIDDRSRDEKKKQCLAILSLCYEALTSRILYGLSLFIVLTGSYVKRLRRLVCASYHPKREQERVQLLHCRILTQRTSLGKALLRSVARSRADAPTNGISILQMLSLRLPGCDFLGVCPVICMACGKGGEGKDDPDMVVCVTAQCKGLYCKECFQSMGNICAVCMGPLTFQEDCEEELDSSDVEQVNLWTAALTSPHITHRRTRKLMKRRISMATHWHLGRSGLWGSRVQCSRASSDVGLVEGERGDSDSSGHISPPSDSDHSEPDMTYQNHSESDNSSDLDQNHHPTFLLSAVCVSKAQATEGWESDSENSEDSEASFNTVSSITSDSSLVTPLPTVTVHRLDHSTPAQPQGHHH